MFADSTTDLILVIFDDSSLLIGLQLQVWSPIFIVWLSLSLISGACAGFLKGEGEELARSAGSEVFPERSNLRQWPGGAAPGKIFN